MSADGMREEKALAGELEPPASSGRRHDLWRQFARSGPVVIGMGTVLALVVLAAVFAPYVAPHDPVATDLRARLLPPAFAPGGSLEHLLGTDHLGRDILSRLMYGGRVSIAVGFGAVVVTGLLGVLLGLLSGYFGGWVDTVIMRSVDIFLAIPFLLLAMCVVAVLGTSTGNLILALVLARWTVYVRMVRGQVLSIRERLFVDAARAIGVPAWRIILRHVLPNVFNPIIVIASLEVANMIIYESGLSFLGLGIQPPTPSWGSMLSDGREYIMTAWWLTTLPGLVILVTVVALNVLGDWLRDVLDPSLRV